MQSSSRGCEKSKKPKKTRPCQKRLAIKRLTAPPRRSPRQSHPLRESYCVSSSSDDDDEGGLVKVAGPTVSVMALPVPPERGSTLSPPHSEVPKQWRPIPEEEERRPSHPSETEMVKKSRHNFSSSFISLCLCNFFVVCFKSYNMPSHLACRSFSQNGCFEEESATFLTS